VLLSQHTGPTRAGATWQVQIPVRISPDSWQTVPVTAEVASRNRSGVSLVGHGQGEGSLFFHGYTFGVDVTVQMSEAFNARGRLQDAEFKVDETTADGKGPPISYNWHFTAR